MNLDELRSVQNRERQTDSLQHLRESFYEEVGRYISDLKTERERAAEAADDPWSDPEVQRLTDEIETAEEVAESVYERRMGKLVKDASLAAAGYATDTEGLTLEEERLFDDLVDRIEDNKSTVLDVLAGEAVAAAVQDTATQEPSSASAAPDADEPATAPDSAGVPTAPDPDAVSISSDADDASATPDGVDAASVMGGDGEPTGPGTEAPPTDPGGNEQPAEASAANDDPLVDDGASTAGSDEAVPEDPLAATNVEPDGPGSDGRPTAGTAEAERQPGRPSSEGGNPGDDATGDSRANRGGEPGATSDQPEATTGSLEDRRTVRITDDVGAILGVDDHEYELSSDDVVTLPEENADPLIERDAAEPID